MRERGISATIDEKMSHNPNTTLRWYSVAAEVFHTISKTSTTLLIYI
jgi:hypothetical protein